MTTITIPDALPRLFIGSHKAGTGRACMMNAISYMNGDKQISDMPHCVWGPFATMVQLINDSICTHLIEVDTGEAVIAMDGTILDGHKNAYALCGPCAHQVWMIGVPLIGTGDLGRQLTKTQRVQLMQRMAVRIVDANWGKLFASLHPYQEEAFSRLWTQVREVVAGTRAPFTFTGVLTNRGLREERMFSSAAATVLTLILDEKLIAAHLQEAINYSLLLGSSRTQEGFRADAYQLSRQLAVFTDWLHEAAGMPVPQQVTITEKDVALVPVGVA